MSDLRSAVAAAAFNEGWTCTAHEPEGNWDDCPDCREALTNLSGVVASITLDAAREAVAAAWIHASEALDPLDPRTFTDILGALDALREEQR